MNFDELVGVLRSGEGAPETIYDDLSSSYALAISGGQERAAQLAAENAAKDAEIARLKAMNFDLLTAVGSPATPPPEDDESDGPPSIESLFTSTKPAR